MKQIKLKSLRLENFKGIRDLTVEFGGSVTEIKGRNATGKTTIYDAITWLLFGKDSFDRKAFEIKTRDVDGVVIPDIPHVVEGVLSVDGETITLRREYNEDWRTRRGTTMREMAGHIESRYYNGVPCSVREYSEKISGICAEKWFKLLSVPTYFNSLKAEERRSLLMEMAGESSVEEVVGDDADLRMLVREMRGKTIMEYSRELSARKKKLKAVLVDIPARIDERKKDTEQLRDIDFNALRARREELSNSINARMDCLSDKSKREDARERERAALVRSLNKSRRDAAMIEQQAKNAAYEGKDKRDAKIRALQNYQRTMETRIASLKSDLQFIDKEILDCRTYREQLLNEWNATNAMQPKADAGGGYTCPTCGHVYNAEEYARYEQAMLDAYSSEKNSKLIRLRQRSEDNDARMDDLNVRRNGTQAQLDSEQAKLNECFREQKEIEDLVIPTADDLLSAKENFAKALMSIKDAEQAIADFDAQPIGDDADEAAITKLCGSIDALNAELREVDAKISQEAVLTAADARIAEMEQAYKEEARKMCDVEHMESLLIAFNRRRGELAESRINALFTNTRFRLLERQVNGMDVDICEAEVGGVPYAGLNSAMRINCGLDIINAISCYLGISAPAIIDNAESVNDILPTAGQQIRLYVTNNNKLSIVAQN